MLNESLRSNLIESISATVHQHPSLETAFADIEPLILAAFNAQRLSLFQRRTRNRDLVARHKTGSQPREIKVTLNTQSIAGYVAMAQQSIVVNDPYDQEAIQSVHSKLKFDKKYDRLNRFKTTNILCVPVKHDGILLGVMEILNKETGDFDNEDLDLAIEVSKVIGEAYQYELGGTSQPFEYLGHKGLLDPKILNNLSNSSNIKYATYLLNTEHDINEEQICEALSIYYQAQYIDYLPTQYHASHTDIKLNNEYLKHNMVAIVKDDRGQIIILMFEPNNTALLMEIENALGTDNYQLAFSLPSKIFQYLGENNETETRSEFDDILGEIHTSEGSVEKSEEFVDDDEPAIVRLVSSVLYEAKRLNASDIHIDPEDGSPTLVRMRVDGIVRDLNQVPESHHNALVSRIKIMSGLNIAEKRVPQDGKLTFNVSGQKVDVRVATIPTVVGEGVVMRLLPSGEVLPLDQINLAGRNVQKLKSLVSIPHGILLVVGPTGSGKTTTLHAILNHLNTPDRKIWTAEDPVEIKQYRLQQVQVNPKIGFTFANALRSFLRADPDVILIGEMRDKETASAGIEASLTGHLVLSTLHTNSAPETITRLLDLGMDPVNFSDACLGILAQRLVRVLCPHCKEKHKPNDTELAFIKRHYGKQYIEELRLNSDTHIYHAKGCPECDNTGYKGRTGVHELLSMSNELRSLVYKGSSVADLKDQAMKDGMRTLVQDALQKVLKGDTDITQVQVLSGIGTEMH
ncbi:ATPase, T2SS/T4P/T4SS family [Paraglaciecola marina]|uniref:ATPase, T2SS/T4P/T4SS family n=1 Tax=Paraglaciecola marina TaxID=2500157 RepID=UPI00105FD5F1|nr:ATPase, T2SS/T4P/T4SS family [Paraglaciecola marina]